MACHVPFTLVLTALTVALSLVPAVIIWVVFNDLMASSVDLLRGTTQNSTDGMVVNVQELLILRAIDKFDARLTEGDREMTSLLATLKAGGLPGYDLRPSRFDVPAQFLTPFHRPGFITMLGHPYFSNVALFAGMFQNPTDAYATRLFWVTWVSFNLDVLRDTFNTTLYCSTLAMAPDEQSTTLNISYVDQVTAAPLFQMSTQTGPPSAFIMGNDPGGWATTLSFNPYSGQVELSTWQWLPAQNNTALQVYISISATTISDELLEELSGSPDDRLVLFFRQPHGYMIAASHGKYWSNSDEDRRSINPLTNPPNISSYHLWNCTRSTDALIQQACQQLYATYKSWANIPAVHQQQLLGGQQYWMATDSSTGDLQATALMLKNRASVMSGVDASNAQVDSSVSDKKGVTYIILGVVSAIAVCLPLGVGFWLAARLYNLAQGMDRIAKLQFATTNAHPTVFRELHRFQSSFTQMERGLQAFGKFVPQAVVKVLIAGQMNATDEMYPETLTVMFADIEGFSTVCETETPATLVTVCTEYFEAMCSNIAQHNGTIDKFIGDCIMAMWNAPDRLPGHERDAVAAALAMKDSVMDLHPGWQRRGLPVLKFRLGLHTGVCLVGNFGCSYRVSYTCLGDGVNLSARLEALNKKFGTYICVSHATYEGCRNYFHFRRLAKVTVPGKTEVLPVYEVLCAQDLGSPKSSRTPKGPQPPGYVNAPPHPDEERLSPSARDLGYARSAAIAEMDNLPCDDQVAYHWTRVDRRALLQYARQYEQAYEALAGGNLTRARQLLTLRPPLLAADKAWTALGMQLESAEAGPPWDGVFYFREK